MHLIPRNQIEVRKRQRSEINPVKLRELRESITKTCLIHPVVVWKEGETYVLVAGERRLTAIDAIQKEGGKFSCDNEEILPGFVPCTFLNLNSSAEVSMQVEFDENEHREPLEWKDRVQALATLHQMRKAANPEQTFKATGEEIVKREGKTDAVWAGKQVREATALVKHLDDPKIAGARNASEAYSLLLKREEETARAALARHRIKKAAGATGTEAPPLTIRQGDLREVLPLLDDGIADLICADLPYGIEAGSGGFRSRTVHHHDYEDSSEYARELIQTVLVEGFRLSKPRANLFIFTDIKHWDFIQTVSAQVGWSPFRRPLIWGKSDSEGLAPWGNKGPRITTEFIFYATKGQKGLLASPIDYLRVNRVARHERVHAAEKPVELMKKLLECTSLPGEFVLDPCCGSGSTLIAAKELHLKGLGIERDEGYYNTAMANLYGEKDAKPSSTTP